MRLTPEQQEDYDERYAIVIADQDSDPRCDHETAHRLAMASATGLPANPQQINLFAES